MFGKRGGADWLMNKRSSIPVSHITVISYYFKSVFSSVKGVVFMMTRLIKIRHSQSSKLDIPWQRSGKISNKQYLKALKLYINSMKNLFSGK
jgi:hypothetical protein